MTSFTRIVIVFHFLRQALGTQEMPSNQMLIGLALFLTMFIMAPVGARINELARARRRWTGKITVTRGARRAARRRCASSCCRQTREADLGLFVELSKAPRARDAGRAADDAWSFPPTSSRS